MKILLFSDPHYSINSKKEDEKWFPPLCKIMPKWAVSKFLQYWDNVTQHAFAEMLMAMSAYGPYDLVVGCGCYTPGTNESGMITDDAVLQYQVFNKAFECVIGDTPRILVWGDHDAGYKFDVSGKTGVKIGTESGGTSLLSVRRAEELIGPAFGLLDLGSKKIVHISTNLIRNVNNSSDKYLRDLQQQQEVFVQNILLDAQEKEVIFLLHDPTALDFNEGIGLLLATHSAKIDVLLHGHMHAKWVAKLMKVFYKPYRQLCALFPTHVVPATWGMFGIGRGFGLMTIHIDDSVQIYWL